MKRVFTVVLAMLIALSAFSQQLGKMPTYKSQKEKQKLMKGIYKNNSPKVVENKNFKSVNTFSNVKSLVKYNFTESSETFTSIHETGTAIIPDGWDDGYYYLNLTGKFSFNYDHKPISTFSVGTNGYLIMGKDKYPSVGNDLADTGLVPVVAPVWDDMKFYGQGDSCGLFYQIDTLPTDTVLTIEWYNIERYGNSGNKVSFQVKFHKANGVIEIVYGDMSAAANWSASASIGINNLEFGKTAFMSITPGSPATMSRSESNNTIDGATLASIATGTVYKFTPNFYDNDLVAMNISPELLYPDTDITPQVTVYNDGLNDAVNYDVKLSIIDQSNTVVYNQTLTISNTLTVDDDTIINMPLWSSVPAGFYTATLTVTYSADDDNNNNTTTQDITVQNGINMQNGDTSICSMLFFDSGGPDSAYQSNENYTLVMHPSTTGKFLQVNFYSYEIENYFDSLYVYNGTSTSAPLIGKISGTGSNLVIKAMNSDGALTFYFTSDGSSTYSGWKALVSCYTPIQHDLSVASISPTATLANKPFNPQVIIKNNAINDETSFDIHYSNTDGTYSGTMTLNENIAAFGGTDTVSLPSWTLNANDTLTVTVTLTGDEDNSNDELVQGIGVINSTTLSGNITSGKYVFIDLSNANEMPIGPIGTSPFPMAEEYDGNNIYRVYSDMSFGTVNMLDGSFTSLGKLSGVNGTPTSMAWNWKNNLMYVLVIDNDNIAHLCSLDFSTLKLTEVASNNDATEIIGMDFVNDSLIYGPSVGNDKLYKININTGVFTQVGDIDIDINYGQDVAYDYDSLRLYTITASDDSMNLGFYDTTTGAFTSVARLTGQHATLVSLTSPAPLYTVTFNVTDGSNPLVNANILVANHILHTNSSGQATIKLIDNTYSAVTSLYGYANVTTDFTLNGTDTTLNITLHALSTYDLAFHVANILGTNIGNASIAVLYGTDTLASGTTDANGNFDAGQQYATYSLHYIVSADGYIKYEADTVLSNSDVLVEVALLENMIKPYALKTNQLNYDADVELTWNKVSGVTEDFESGTLDEGWDIQQTCTDQTYSTPGYWTINNYSNSDFGPFGTYHAGLWFSYDHQDEWLITPEFIAGNGMTLNFYSVCAHGSPHGDHYYVKVSADGGNTWDVVWDASALPYVDNDGDGEADIFYYDQVYTVDLSSYEGKNIKVAFQAVDGDGGGLWFIFFVDNISIESANGKCLTFSPSDLKHISYSAHKLNSHPTNTSLAKSGKYNRNIRNVKAFESFNVFLDSNQVATGVTDSSYIFQNLSSGLHNAGVCGVYTTGNSDTAYIDFTVLSKYNLVFKVLNAVDSTPLSGATVTLSNTDTTINLTTDANGLTDTVNIVEGNYSYTVSATGYLDNTTNLEFHSDSTVTVLMTIDNTAITAANKQIVIYPNPVKEVVSIKTDGNYTLKIIDIDGRTVLTTKLHDNSNNVNMAELPAGIYFLQLNSNKASYNFRIVKK